MNLYEAIKVLAGAGVEFVIVGGQALRSHGSAYLTEDLDICYSREPSNLKRIAVALAPYQPRPRNFPDELPFVWDWSTLLNGTNFTFRTTLGDIDLLGEVAGIGSYSDVLAESIAVDVEGFPLRILSIDGLIRAKETAGRVKDQLGLQELYALREAREDKDEP
jgi:predicted nucleotidyltransferase